MKRTNKEIGAIYKTEYSYQEILLILDSPDESFSCFVISSSLGSYTNQVLILSKGLNKKYYKRID